MEMNIVLTLRAELVLLSIISNIIVLFFLGIRGKRNYLTYLFIVFQVITLLWSIFEFCEVYTFDTKSKWFITQLKFFPICFISVIWLIFSLYYSDNKILKKKLTIPLLISPSAVLYLFCVTNNYHYLYFDVFNYHVTGYGILFWVHTAESYLYALCGLFLMLRQYYKIEKSPKQIIIIAAITVPMLINVLHVFKVLATPFDITPLFFPLSMTFFMIATYNLNFLNVMPFAYKKIFDNLEESVIVIDNLQKIVSYNKAFNDMFSGKLEFSIDTPFETFKNSLKLYSNSSLSDESILSTVGYTENNLLDNELELFIPNKKIFRIKVRRVFDNKKEIAGRCILFQDITEYKNLINNLEEKNVALSAYTEELTTVNEKLKEHMLVLEELTLSKERNRIAREVHDTIGHTLTMIIMIIRIIKKYVFENNRDQILKKLDDIMNISQSGLDEIRNSIKALKQETENSKDIILALERLIKCSSSHNVHIDLSVMGMENYQSIINSKNIEKLGEVSYKICKEAITNAIRHGKAEEINVLLKFSTDVVKLYIIDNGVGCKEISKGYGLKGMEERVSMVSGSVVFGTGEKGFNIHVELPVEVAV